MNTNRMDSATVRRVKADPRVTEVWDEGDDGLWAYLKPGFAWDGEVHALHEATLRDFGASLKRIRICNCNDCKPTI